MQRPRRTRHHSSNHSTVAPDAGGQWLAGIRLRSVCWRGDVNGDVRYWNFVSRSACDPPKNDRVPLMLRDLSLLGENHIKRDQSPTPNIQLLAPSRDLIPRSLILACVRMCTARVFRTPQSSKQQHVEQSIFVCTTPLCTEAISMLAISPMK